MVPAVNTYVKKTYFHVFKRPFGANCTVVNTMKCKLIISATRRKDIKILLSLLAPYGKV